MNELDIMPNLIEKKQGMKDLDPLVEVNSCNQKQETVED